MATIKVGFLGSGWVAGIHAQALNKLEGVEIAAVCNPHVEKAQALSDKFAGGRAASYGNFSQMLSNQAFDALYVCLPPGVHNGETEAAAAKGIHIFLEKPIALNLNRATSMYNAITKAGVKCQIGHHMRHTGPSIKLKQMIADGSAGKPLMLQGRFFTNALYPAWWRDPQRGGGQLVEQSIHIYDIARYFLGEAQIAAGFRDNLVHQRIADYKVDDVSASVVRFQNGGLASICAANCADPTAGSITFTMICEKVYAHFRTIDDATFVYHGGKSSEEIGRGEGKATSEEVKSSGSCYDEINRNFIAALRGKEQLRSSITDGVESLRVVLAVAQSSENGGQPQLLA